MAAEHSKATALSNADSVPRIINNARVMRMPAWEAVGTVEATGAADIGSTYRLCRVPSNARI